MRITPRKYALALIEAIAEDKPEDAVRNFLKLLWRKRQFRLIPKILRIFEEEWNERHGILKFNVWCPEKFIKALDELKTHAEEISGRKIEMSPFVDNSLIGGCKVHCNNVLIDASVKGQLKRLKERLYAN